jgi:hypothetical protein
LQRITVATLAFALAACLPRPPAPVQAQAPREFNHPEAEPLLLSAANAFAKKHAHDLDVRWVWPLSDGWEMVRNDYGVITARGVHVGFYVFDPTNQQCWLWRANMYQQAERGGAWGKAFLDPLETVQVTCDSLEVAMKSSDVGVKQP